MNIALFAARQVGYQIAKFFGDNQEPLSCLVIDSKEQSDLNLKIISESGISPDGIIFSDTLYNELVLSSLKTMELDLIILAWWPYIIKKPLIELARFGCLNFHPSYLPYNRGKHYNFWSIIEESDFGVTLHFIDGGVDTGDIAFQSIIEKDWEDTGETLFYKAQDEIVQLFKKKFPEIKSGAIPRIPQDLSKGSFHKGEELHLASKIDLNKNYSGREILNILRARTFPPHPGAWFTDNGQKFEVRIEIKKIADYDGR